MKKRTMTLVVGISWLLLGAAPVTEEVWVQQETVQIREGKGAVYPVVAVASKGTKLTVLDHERKWLKVQLNDKAGYVFEISVAGAQVNGDAPPLFVVPDNQSSVLSAGSATAGLQEDTQTYGQVRNLRAGIARLNALIARRGTISPQIWETFTSSGKIGPDAP
jgi:hypothetical protein